MAKKLRRLVLLWHRWLGLASVPFVVLLVVTGVMLEHTEALRLDERNLNHDGLLAWYGIEAASDPISHRAGDKMVTWLDGTLYLDGKSIYQTIEIYVGSVAVGPAIVVASDAALFLFADNGDLVEKVTPIGVDGALLGLAAGSDDTILVRTESGAFMSDLDMIVWQPTARSTVDAPQPVETPQDLLALILESHRGVGLPWERVVLDLHSGRLFGRFGPYIMDGAAVMLILLSATGVYNWTRRR